jgi:hypothetical protein
LLRFSSPGYFISHSVHSSLNVYFDSVNEPMDFSHGIVARGPKFEH